MLSLDEPKRRELWLKLTAEIEDYIHQVETLPVAPKADVSEIRRRLKTLDFEQPLDAIEALDFSVSNLREFQVHTPHPRYFGLFNPAPTTMGIAADALAAAFNPQMAAWSHSPFAAEVERHLIRSFAIRFGYDIESADGTFCSGGAEANHTALIAALAAHFPNFAADGVRSLKKQPVLYVSEQAHHSLSKAARFCGLGANAVHTIETDENFRMSIDKLKEKIADDRANGFEPFFVAATAGTTSGGIVEELEITGEIAKREKLWFHVDAAWGGAAVFVPELRETLNGIGQADSITFDAHKWLSVPMGAGIFLTRHPEILAEACGIATDYMPRDAVSFGVKDPFNSSMQWSRRFIGFKVFLSLMVAGWTGYAEAIRHQTAMGELLRHELENDGWEIVNQTILPVICFRDQKSKNGKSKDFLTKIVDEAVAGGQVWISLTSLNPQTPVLRACITNYLTAETDVHFLVKLLDNLRADLG